MVNYLLRRRNPTPFLQSFILSTLYNFSGGSRAIIAGLQEKKPDYIFYLRRGPEFPGPAFQMRGNGGFAEESLRWIESHYHEVDRIGPASNDFNELFFVLWKRNTP